MDAKRKPPSPRRLVVSTIGTVGITTSSTKKSEGQSHVVWPGVPIDIAQKLIRVGIPVHIDESIAAITFVPYIYAWNLTVGVNEVGGDTTLSGNIWRRFWCVHNYMETHQPTVVAIVDTLFNKLRSSSSVFSPKTTAWLSRMDAGREPESTLILDTSFLDVTPSGGIIDLPINHTSRIHTSAMSTAAAPTAANGETLIGWLERGVTTNKTGVVSPQTHKAYTTLLREVLRQTGTLIGRIRIRRNREYRCQRVPGLTVTCDTVVLNRDNATQVFLVCSQTLQEAIISMKKAVACAAVATINSTNPTTDKVVIIAATFNGSVFVPLYYGSIALTMNRPTANAVLDTMCRHLSPEINLMAWTAVDDMSLEGTLDAVVDKLVVGLPKTMRIYGASSTKQTGILVYPAQFGCGVTAKELMTRMRLSITRTTHQSIVHNPELAWEIIEWRGVESESGQMTMPVAFYSLS